MAVLPHRWSRLTLTFEAQLQDHLSMTLPFHLWDGVLALNLLIQAKTYRVALLGSLSLEGCVPALSALEIRFRTREALDQRVFCL